MPPICPRRDVEKLFALVCGIRHQSALRRDLEHEVRRRWRARRRRFVRRLEQTIALSAWRDPMRTRCRVVPAARVRRPEEYSSAARVRVLRAVADRESDSRDDFEIRRCGETECVCCGDRNIDQTRLRIERHLRRVVHLHRIHRHPAFDE